MISSAIINYLVALDPLLAWPAPVQILACAALIGTPVFFSAVCFSRLFARETATGYALEINLVGAMAGGFVE